MKRLLITSCMNIENVVFQCRCVYSFPASPCYGTIRVKFNYDGTRLLCSESEYSVAIYDIATQKRLDGTEKILYNPLFKGVGFKVRSCLAGKNDEFVVGGTHPLHIWKLP